jgi:lysyl-tRNA synthetase class I
VHWAEKIAKQLIQNHPERQTFVCASGISPSGSVHIGNFREIVTTYFVTKALGKYKKNVRFIFSWDDFDRFRKVPMNIDPAFERYIGMPTRKFRVHTDAILPTLNTLRKSLKMHWRFLILSLSLSNKSRRLPLL